MAQLPTLVVRCLIERKGDQWQAFSLEYGLAAQAESSIDAKRKLRDMVEEYLFDALVGEDQAHAVELLSRRATWQVFAKYYYARCLSSGRGIYASVVPVAPVHSHA